MRIRKYVIPLAILAPILISFSINTQMDRLEQAYEKGSIAMVNNFIYGNRLKCNNSIKDDTTKNVYTLMNEFIKIYSNETQAIQRKLDNPNRPGSEKFIIVQPEIEVGLVNYNLDASNSYSFKRTDKERKFDDDILYPNKGVFKPFLSVNRFNIQGITSISKKSYCFNNKEKYQVISTDTNLVKTIQNFLKKQGAEHKKRADFIKKSVYLVKTNLVDKDPSVGKFDYMAFNYNFYIDRIVFDKAMNNALIYYSFFSQSNEAVFSKKDNKWIMQKSHPTVFVN